MEINSINYLSHIMRFILPIILIAVFNVGCNVYETNSVSNEILNENGSLIARGKKVHTKSKTMDQYDYYQKWENEYIEYYENGLIKSIYNSSHKSSSYGRPCRELLSHYIIYYPSGIKAEEQKDICDCSKSIYTTYDEDGKIIEKRIIKRKTKNVNRK